MRIKPVFVFLIVLLFLQSTGAFSKTIRLSNDVPLQEQMTETNTTYVFKGTFDLGGQVISCPSGSCLKFKKGCLVLNGGFVGHNTRIKAGKRTKYFMENVMLSGLFSNDKSYLSWWNVKEDVTSEVNSLTSSFDGHIYLDREGTLSNFVYIWNKKDIIIDGCNNTFILHNIPNNCFFAQKNKNIEFRDINITFSGCNTSGKSSIIRCFRIEHCANSTVSIHDVSIRGFNNVNDTPCSFVGINVMYCNKGTNTNIEAVSVSDITVKGDGVEINNPGGNYGIVVSCNSEESGVVDICNCSMSRLSNVDTNGKRIYEDTSGIYIAGQYADNSVTKYCHWNAKIHDCFFEDVSKRNIKVQGDYVVIKSIQSNCSNNFLQDFKNMFVGAEGNHLVVEDLNGRYDGSMVKITGDYLTANNIHCSSNLRDSEYARFFVLDGCLHANISDCTFDNETYIFIYPTERSFSDNVQPIYSFSNCNLRVKHLIYSVSSQKQIFEKGILSVDDSEISLFSTVCFNGRALKEIRLYNTRLKYRDRLYETSRTGRSVKIIENNSSIIKID